MQINWEDLELQVLTFDDLSFESQDITISSPESSQKTLKQRTMSQSCDRTYGDFFYRDYAQFQDPFETGHPLFWVTTKQYDPIMFRDDKCVS